MSIFSFLMKVLCCAMTNTISAERTVVLWIWSAPDQVGVFNEIAAAFERENPDLKINLVVPDMNTYQEKLKVAIAAGAAPDVAYVSQGWIPPMVHAFSDLKPYVQRDGFDLNAYFPAVINSFYTGNKLAALPFDFMPHAIVYNVGLFDAAGIKRPPNLVADMERWKWNDFRDAARKIQQRNPDGTIKIGGFRQSAHWRDIYFLLWQNGAEFLNPTRTHAALNTSRGKEAYQFFVDLINTYDASPKISEIGSVTFETGKAGMQSAAQGAGPNRSYSWDYTFMPWNTNKATTMSLAGYTMLSQTRVPEEAWRVIGFFAGEQGGKIHAQTAWPRNVPAIRSAASSQIFLERNPYYRVTVQSTAFARIPDTNFTYRYDDINKLATAELRNMLELKNSVAVGMEKIAAGVDAMLAEDAAKGLVW